MEGYIIITPPMIEDLGLKGTELLCFAVIHGYSMDRQGVFTVDGWAQFTLLYRTWYMGEKGVSN